jgi:hypothetical protein
MDLSAHGVDGRRLHVLTVMKASKRLEKNYWKRSNGYFKDFALTSPSKVEATTKAVKKEQCGKNGFSMFDTHVF